MAWGLLHKCSSFISQARKQTVISYTGEIMYSSILPFLATQHQFSLSISITSTVQLPALYCSSMPLISLSPKNDVLQCTSSPMNKEQYSSMYIIRYEQRTMCFKVPHPLSPKNNVLQCPSSPFDQRTMLSNTSRFTKTKVQFLKKNIAHQVQIYVKLKDHF